MHISHSYSAIIHKDGCSNNDSSDVRRRRYEVLTGCDVVADDGTHQLVLSASN